jgi:hypothetical protein
VVAQTVETEESYGMILSTACLPNIQYFTKLLKERVVIELHENYIKQTYRNRCEILTGNGVMPLIIPVRHTGSKIKVTDVMIDNSERWQERHWKTICSAYRSSPFFKYYEDDFRVLYREKEDRLTDFNRKALDMMMELAGVRTEITTSDDFVSSCMDDFRYSITPKSKAEDRTFTPFPYYQVFGHKFGFCPNLSIIDLLCNEGNNSITVIRNCCRHTAYPDSPGG